MTPSEALQSHRSMINELGEEIVIRRYTGTGAARLPVDLTTMARVMSYQASEIVGAVVQGDIKVIALVDTLSDMLPLRTTDFIVIRGDEKSIKAVDDNTRRIAGCLIALEIQVKG